MNASVVPRGQNGHSDALVVASLFELTDDLGDLSVGPGAEIDLGHPLLLDLFLSCVQRNLSELRVLGIVRILDEKAVARLKVFVTALFSITYYSSQVGSQTQFYSVGFSQSRIGVEKCVFDKRTIKA